MVRVPRVSVKIWGKIDPAWNQENGAGNLPIPSGGMIDRYGGRDIYKIFPYILVEGPLPIIPSPSSKNLIRDLLRDFYTALYGFTLNPVRL